MRTTIDLPEDLHAMATSIARDNKASLSETIAQLLRLAVGGPRRTGMSTSPVTGLRVVSLGRTITSDDVRSLDDEE